MAQIIGERTALQGVAAVDNKGVAVFPELRHAVGKAGVCRQASGIINRREAAVDVAGIINRKMSFHGISFRFLRGYFEGA